jgi:hypothetical protein
VWARGNHEVDMVLMRIAVLCGCGLALGGCLSTMAHTGAYTALQPTVDSDAALPPVTEPGQLLKPGLGRTAGGANPLDDLRSSERARMAWAPIHSDKLPPPPSLAAHPAALTGAGSINPAGTAALSTPAQGGAARGAETTSYDREAIINRLVKEGRKDANPICGGC